MRSLQTTETLDQECLRINSAASTGEHRRLLGVELTARGLESFSFYNPSLGDTVKLPEWTHSDRMAWPPPKIPLGVLMAMSMVPQHDPMPWRQLRRCTGEGRSTASGGRSARSAEEDAARQGPVEKRTRRVCDAERLARRFFGCQQARHCPETELPDQFLMVRLSAFSEQSAAAKPINARLGVLINSAQCPLRSESDRNASLQRNDAMGQKATFRAARSHTRPMRYIQ